MDRQMGAFAVRARRPFALVLLGALALALVPGGAQAQVAATPFADADFKGYATGTVVHTDALQQGTNRLENSDQAFSGASVASKKLSAQLVNETQRVVQPVLGDKFSFGRGIALDVGLQQALPVNKGSITLPTDAPLDSAALPSTDLRTSDLLGATGTRVATLAYASAVRAQSQARWPANGADCILGADLSRGLGYIADAQLVGSGPNADGTLTNPILGIDAPNPERAVSQSTSRTLLTRQVNRAGASLGPNFGLMSEARMTIAPVTLLRGSSSQLTIEFLGEWVLQAVAGGVAGGAFVHYGPGTVNPQTHVLRVLDQAGNVVVVGGQRLELTLQQILGPDGRQIVNVPGVAEITIGERPRRIGGAFGSGALEEANGTTAAAAVDVARIKILEQATVKAAEVRVGHMEVSSTVPLGGIGCSIPVTKVANPPSVFIGTPFTTTITVNNPFDCDLTAVRLTDDVTTQQNARFKVQGSDPAANTIPAGENLASGQLVWNDIGPIPPGGSKVVSATFMPQNGAGLIIDKATATGTLANCRGAGASVAGVGVGLAGAGITGVSGELKVGVGEVLGEQLARTGPGPKMAFFAGLALLTLAGMGRVLSKRII